MDDEVAHIRPKRTNETQVKAFVTTEGLKKLSYLLFLKIIMYLETLVDVLPEKAHLGNLSTQRKEVWRGGKRFLTLLTT